MGDVLSRQTTVPRRSTGASALRLLRPRQWVKNAVCLAPAVFSDSLPLPRADLRELAAAAASCALASAVYGANDVRDARRDRLHPVKCRRPVASGELSPRAALAVSTACALLGLAAATLWLGTSLFYIQARYRQARYRFPAEPLVAARALLPGARMNSVSKRFWYSL